MVTMLYQAKTHFDAITRIYFIPMLNLLCDNTLATQV